MFKLVKLFFLIPVMSDMNSYKWFSHCHSKLDRGRMCQLATPRSLVSKTQISTAFRSIPTFYQPTAQIFDSMRMCFIHFVKWRIRIKLRPHHGNDYRRKMADKSPKSHRKKFVCPEQRFLNCESNLSFLKWTDSS